MKEAFLSLGGNLGDRRKYLEAAVDALRTTPGISDVQCSSFRETAPVGRGDQPSFLNAAVRIRTSLGPEELLAVLQSIESRLGRVRDPGNRWGPRTIDMDLLVYEGVRMRTETLEIPHPRMAERRFVLEPLAELAPDLQIDERGTVRDLLARLAETDQRPRSTGGSPGKAGLD